MNCSAVQERLQPGLLDRLEGEPRAQLLIHLQGCRSCRAQATSVDPSIIFSLMSVREVESEEVEEIRHTVQAMRRIRAIEASWARYGQRGLWAGALAALLLVAVVLMPGSSPEPVNESIPFAGALGVGSGLVTVPTEYPGSGEVSLRIDLERTVAGESEGFGSDSQRITQTVISPAPGAAVDRVLADRYRIRFEVSSEASGSDLTLNDLTVTDLGNQQEVLLNADLRPVMGRPLILGLSAPSEAETTLWLRLTWLAADESR